MNLIERLIKAARRRQWCVDVTEYSLRKNGTGKIVFAVTLVGEIKGIVFFNHVALNFFGCLLDGTQFASSDTHLVGEPWFKELTDFFTEKCDA